MFKHVAQITLALKRSSLTVTYLRMFNPQDLNLGDSRVRWLRTKTGRQDDSSLLLLPSVSCETSP